MHNKDCKICILNTGVVHFEFLDCDHWAGFVTQTWQPCLEVSTFNLVTQNPLCKSNTLTTTHLTLASWQTGVTKLFSTEM